MIQIPKPKDEWRATNPLPIIKDRPGDVPAPPNPPATNKHRMTLQGQSHKEISRIITYAWQRAFSWAERPSIINFLFTFTNKNPHFMHTVRYLYMFEIWNLIINCKIYPSFFWQ
jgi:hypothetical protein